MSFSFFRKHEKAFLWTAVVFTVVVFALFSSFSDVESAFNTSTFVRGTYQVANTGETREVTDAEFNKTMRALARWNQIIFGGQQAVSEDDVWAHMITDADAQAAGLHISDDEMAGTLQQVAQMLTGSLQVDLNTYRAVITRLGYASMRDFEELVRSWLRVTTYRDANDRMAAVVGADEVYQRWRVDNELFDLTALVFPDLEPEAIADPGDEVLRQHYDDKPEFLRDRIFASPATHDVAYAWLDLADDLSGVDAEILERVPEVDDAVVEQRFRAVQSARFPEVEELDDALRATLGAEARVISLVTEAHREFLAPPLQDADEAGSDDEEAGDDAAEAEEEQDDLQRFLETMESWGLATADPEGQLGPDELAALEVIGSDVLAPRLARKGGGETYFLPPFGEETVAFVVFVEETVESVPLPFEECRDLVLDDWREGEKDGVARSWREGLTELARALPEAIEAAAPLEAQAEEAAAARIAAAEEPLDEEAQAAIREEELAAVDGLIQSRLAEYEVLVWEDALADFDGEILELADVSRRPPALEEGEDPTTLDRFLRTNGQIFQLAVDGITGVLRHTPGSQSVVVRVTDRRFPDEAAMRADEEGMLQARNTLANERRLEVRSSYDPVQIGADHGLTLFEPPAPVDPEGA